MDIIKPVPSKIIVRVIFIALVIVSLFAGYYHASFINERKKYKRLEDMYVRVRGELGIEETQRLIDISRERDGLQTPIDW